jgi:hypothetical protein
MTYSDLNAADPRLKKKPKPKRMSRNQLAATSKIQAWM